MDQESREELRADMLQEAKENDYYEKKMYEDQEFCLEQFSDDLEEIANILKTIQKRMSEFGHDLSMLEITQEVV